MLNKLMIFRSNRKKGGVPLFSGNKVMSAKSHGFQHREGGGGSRHAFAK